MNGTASQPNYLEQVELYVTKVVTTEFSDKLVFHDIDHTHKVISGIKEIAKGEGISDEEKELCLIAGWLSYIGFKDLENFGKISDPIDFFVACSKCTKLISEEFLQSIDYPEDKIKQILFILDDASVDHKPESKLGKILADAMTIEWALKKGKKRLELRYQELLLTDAISVGKSGFYEVLLDYLQSHEYYTDYGKEHLGPKRDNLILRIEKDKKDIGKNEQLALKKELDISDEELKKLKKSLNSVKGRDERGIQTMFRTTSRNHYTLNQMVDRKANIMISVNAIILSLILSRIIGTIDTFCIHNAPILVMLITSIISIIFAIIAITPIRSHGEFTEQEIREKQGNLLYFGNYHNMAFREYNWGMLQMLNDSDYLYTSMIKDLYFLGQMLSRKYKHIRISLGAFMVGFVITVIFFLIVSSMSDFHIGGVGHS